MPKSSIASVAVGLLLMAIASPARAEQSLAELNSHEVNYRHQMLWDKDAETLREIISVWSIRISPKALGIAQYYSKLGTALRHTGDNPGAEQAFRSAITILEANGPLYAEAAGRVKYHLAGLLIKEHRTDEADELTKGLPPVPPRVKNDVDPELILSSKVEPAYTALARADKVSGDVDLALTIDETGHARDFRIIQPLGFGLDENAIKAVTRWKFKPALRNGAPATSPAEIEVSFRLL